ncbi:unnamed protein product [Durusdinium trenchii]|uniref:Uncharacterized protein n=1 Tax=Durusdinium trenchii TaxID=1381693 RepID=A0ABP0PTP7_9DINO
MALPEGLDSDRLVDDLRQAAVRRQRSGPLQVKHLLDIQEKLQDKLQVPRAKSFLQDILQTLNPEMNPGGYRICQDEMARIGGAQVLIQTVASQNDLLRSLALEALARMMFGNVGVAEAVMQKHDLLPTLRTVFIDGSIPERLTAFQLAQVMAASELLDGECAIALMQEAKFLLQENFGFPALSHAALDVFVSMSFTHPTEVIGSLGWPQIKQLLHDQEDPLQGFCCGLLASNCLSSMPVDSDTAELRQSLAAGPFLQSYVECLEASLKRCDWPESSKAFHSPRRLALVAGHLATQGFHRHLLPAVPLLVQAVESFSDAVPALLIALRALAADPQCLRSLLDEEVFRQSLDSFHRAGDAASTDLLSYMEMVESAFAAGEAAKLAQTHENPQAPTVLELAEVFSRLCPLDGKLDSHQLPDLCAQVPLAPLDRVRSSLHCDLTLQAFLEHVYGTPTILGWWPSLMEEAASHISGSGLALSDLCRVFEMVAKRGSVELQDLHDVVLPALELPTEGEVVEEKFAELHGSAPLTFRTFAKWLADLNIKLQAASEESHN